MVPRGSAAIPQTSKHISKYSNMNPLNFETTVVPRGPAAIYTNINPENVFPRCCAFAIVPLYSSSANLFLVARHRLQIYFLLRDSFGCVDSAGYGGGDSCSWSGVP
jgi:hypothetical protein